MPTFGIIMPRESTNSNGETVKEFVELEDTAALKKWLIENPAYAGPVYRLEEIKARIELVIDRQPVMRG